MNTYRYALRQRQQLNKLHMHERLLPCLITLAHFRCDEDPHD